MSSLGLKHADFKDRPGYETKPAKVWRSGVGWVDGYKWRCKVPKVKTHKRQVDMQDLEKMIAPATRKHAEKAHADMLTRPTEVLYSGKGKEYVSPESADRVADKNGWRTRASLLFLGSGVSGEFCPGCDRRTCWCECS